MPAKFCINPTKAKCQTCVNYKPDKNRQNMACFAKPDKFSQVYYEKKTDTPQSNMTTKE